jgi:DNA-directed RNA polymerase subunit beta'
MVESMLEKITDYGSVRISIASPEDIRSWSYGEVKKPETINYRTYRAERDGLFCERIFGPERDWECACGKYKGMKHKGIVCDRCGVKVTHSRVRRKRMGHINLAAPVVHIWFLKALPSQLGTLLGMKVSALERIVYYQDYVVTDPGDTPLKRKDLLTEEELRAAREKYGEDFKADTGAEAVRALLKQLDLDKLAKESREELLATKSKQQTKDITKRLKTVEALRDSGNRSEWLVMDVIPVIPPDLRPLVLLESGNFATSDLNDLYRRIINRNNRLKKLVDLNAPEVIIRNEKRMLQQTVDALFDNQRTKRPVLGSSNRPLKSLTDMIKGKQGRFRENLLGKRVDYSARSVIVVGPELKLHQCGLPKKIALELYQPFIIRRLKERGLADTIKSAKKMLDRKDEQVWDILEEVIQKHPVLLNRAPTLHRMGIQAFEPVLIEGNAIKIHPLVCHGFNADFDGDQMAVHLPLSVEAQAEAYSLMLATNNIFSPASGEPLITASQDIVLGVYYLTAARPGEPGEGKMFSGAEEVFAAHQMKKIGIHAQVKVRLRDRIIVKDRSGAQEPGNGICTTTVGRVIFNEILPAGMPYYNYVLDKKAIDGVISDCHKLLGRQATIDLLDSIKTLGFRIATLAGLSFSTEDLKMPRNKAKILEETQAQVEKIERFYQQGVITEGERYNQVIDTWLHATDVVAEEMMKELRDDTRQGKPYLNPIFLMVDSGARGSMQQIRQLAGMRGLMAKPSGKIIETPIRANFREGLHVLEYFSSTHGARKGLADTALKTAESGYLTRKLADVAQNMVVTEDDCGTTNGITKGVIYRGDKVEVSLAQAIRGRVARDNIVNLITDEVIVNENELITDEIAKKIEALGLQKIRVRSPLTCESPAGVCSKCYGMDLSRGRLVERGLAVGIMAAQSIGEPGTQLTMRTFHIGGTASRAMEESEIFAKRAGVVRFNNLSTVVVKGGDTVVLNRNGEILILDEKGRELERYAVPVGAILRVKDGEKVTQRRPMAKWDPHMIPILAEMPGRVRFEDIIEGKTMREEVDPQSKVKRKVIIEHKGELHPQVILEDKTGKILGVYPIPEKANVEVDEGEAIEAGAVIAKTPREISGTQDITSGLPRVTELFEARRPRDPAVISEIDGIAELGEKRRRKRTIIVRNESGIQKEHLVPHGKHLRVHRGDRVRAGEPLVEGPLVLQDILRISGEEELQQHLLREIQNVYRAQNTKIDDKHIEIIIRQMMRKVRVEEVGDTSFLPGAVVDKFRFREENQRAMEKDGKPATAKPLLLGITKAALQSESFISAASFQETTKVLTEAALAGRVDRLTGLKENVIVGHLIPAGTGFKDHYATLAKPTAAETLSVAEARALLGEKPAAALEEKKK